MVSAALNWISGQPYRPRNSALLRALAAKKTVTLHGCVLIPQSKTVLRISREFSVVERQVAQAGAPWDGRISMVNAENHMKFGRLAPLALGNARGGGTVAARVWRFCQPIFVARAKAFGRTNGAIWPKRYA